MRFQTLLHEACFLALAMLLTVQTRINAQTSSQDWPQFRGPSANPIAENSRLPEAWSAVEESGHSDEDAESEKPELENPSRENPSRENPSRENIEWSVDLPGRGWSSPIVSGGKIFVTTAITDGESKPPQAGTDYSNEYVAELTKQGLSGEELMKKVQERDFELASEVNLHFWIYCLDLDTGEPLWKDEFYAGHPAGGRHRKNSFASETPVTDGKRVYVYIAGLGLYAYNMDGTRAWTTKLKAYPIYLEFGTGSSPVLCDDQLIIVNDNEENAFIAAFNTSDGTERWRTTRKPAELKSSPGPAPKSGWVTPYVWHNKLRTEIVTMQPGVAISYDTSGEELWRMKGMTVAPAASSFAVGEHLILNGGKRSPIFAIKPGATGEIQATGDKVSDFISWTAPRTGTYIPTPVAYKGGIYVLDDKGIITKLDASNGKTVYKHRLGNQSPTITSSPWAYNDRVFCLSEQGDTYVLQASDEYKLLRVNPLGDFTMSTPAIAGDRLILRTQETLYCIRETGAAASAAQ